MSSRILRQAIDSLNGIFILRPILHDLLEQSSCDIDLFRSLSFSMISSEINRTLQYYSLCQPIIPVPWRQSLTIPNLPPIQIQLQHHRIILRKILCRRWDIQTPYSRPKFPLLTLEFIEEAIPYLGARGGIEVFVAEE